MVGRPADPRLRRGPGPKKLVVNEDEADRVRQIFELYLEHEALLPVVEELDRRGWRNKSWTTRKGRANDGRAFDKTSLYKLLTNVLYVGKVAYKTELHPGEQPGIVDPAVWEQVQTVLARNGRTGGKAVRNKFGAFLKGILRCGPCGCAMTPSHSTKTARSGTATTSARGPRSGAGRPARRSRCRPRRSKTWSGTGSGRWGRTRPWWPDVLAAARKQDDAWAAALRAELKTVGADLRAWHAELKAVSADVRPGADNAPRLARLADLQERIGAGETRVRVLQDQLEDATRRPVDPALATEALAEFDRVWESLTLRERERLVRLLVERVTYDGAKGTVTIAFRTVGIQTLAGPIPHPSTGERHDPFVIECPSTSRPAGRGGRRWRSG